MVTKSNQVCAYLAEQANYLIGRIDKFQKVKKSFSQEIEAANTLIAQSLGAISVICRDGATEGQLIEFQKYGERMNAAVRF